MITKAARDGYIFGRLVSKMEDIVNSKGVAYSQAADPGDDVNANFKRAAKVNGGDQKKALWTFFLKHFDAVENAIVTGDNHSGEDLEEKIVDMMLYLGILGSMWVEEDVIRTWNTVRIPEQVYHKEGDVVRCG